MVDQGDTSRKEGRGPERQGPARRSRAFLLLFSLLTILIVVATLIREDSGETAVLRDREMVLELLHEGKLDREKLFFIPQEYEITGVIERTEEEKEKGLPTTFAVTIVSDDSLKEFEKEIDDHNRAVRAERGDEEYQQKNLETHLQVKTAPGALWDVLINVFLIVVFIFILYFLFFRQLRGGGPGGALFSFGKSRARMTEKGATGVTFDDVAGINEAKEEVQEIIEFLKDSNKFHRLGGRIPRGVVLAGAPGTGKTLLAKAIAGEADVPFFSISGSDFVEMFVGVGASRVRDLFRQARQNSPCIVFFDEIDAVGRRRGAGLGGGHDEREQTLNAILVEMDGFESDAGIVVVAATNRPDVLDPALLRPGRFDREIFIDLPDVDGREEILRVHIKGVTLADDVNVRRLAQITPTFSGAELAAMVNEGAIRAAMSGSDAVHQEDLEQARDKIRWGKEKKSRALSELDRTITAYHEAGHAILAHLLPEVEPLHKVTIIPRGMALGATMQLSERDQYHYTRKQLQGNLMVLFGGRIAEKIFCDDITAGAKNDIERATDLARRMICEWGMSDVIGPVNYSESEETLFLGREVARSQNHSEAMAQKIDEEVRRLLDQMFQKAEKVIRKHRDEVERIARALLLKETLSGEEVDVLVRGGTLDIPGEPVEIEASSPAEDEESAEPLPARDGAPG